MEAGWTLFSKKWRENRMLKIVDRNQSQTGPIFPGFLIRFFGLLSVSDD
jgi:hypothetical protein